MYRTRVPRVDETRPPGSHVDASLQSVLRSIGPMAYRFLRGQLILPAAVSATALLRSNLDHLERRHSMAGCEARNNRAAEGVKIARNLAASSRTSWHKKRRRRLEAGPGLGCALGRGYGFSRSARVSWRLLLNLELRRRAHQNSTRTSAQFGPRPFCFSQQRSFAAVSTHIHEIGSAWRRAPPNSIVKLSV